MAFFVAAVAAALAFEGAGAIALPVALTLVGTMLWLQGRPRELALQEEITASLKQWMAASPDQPEVSSLRQAFKKHFQGGAMLERDPEEGQRLLRAAVSDFARFLDDYQALAPKEQSTLAGLAASANLHRARARFMLMPFLSEETAEEEELQEIRASLRGFEAKFQPWRILVLPAIALRIELHLRLGAVEEAEFDQELLDAHAEGGARDPEICATRCAIADHLWKSAESQPESPQTVSALQTRALIHYDAWLSQVGNSNVKARIIVAIRNDEIEKSECVVSLLSDLIDDQKLIDLATPRDLLDANRFLGRAHLRLRHFDRALRHFSVLMSVNSKANIYLRDEDVLREIGEAEAAVVDSPPEG